MQKDRNPTAVAVERGFNTPLAVSDTSISEVNMSEEKKIEDGKCECFKGVGGYIPIPNLPLCKGHEGSRQTEHRCYRVWKAVHYKGDHFCSKGCLINYLIKKLEGEIA